MSHRTCSRRSVLRGIVTGTVTAGLGAGAATAAGRTVGEVGRITTGQTTESAWHTVSFSGSYDDPVVVMNPLTHDSTHPADVRIRNVTADSFEYQIEEWQYLDGVHGPETAAYAVFEAGSYTLCDGTPVTVGTAEVGSGWQRVSFGRAFADSPVVLSQVQTYRGYQTVTTRHGNVTSGGAGVRLQEEEAFGWHKREEVGYVAVGRGGGGGAVEAGVRDGVTDEWTDIAFSESYDEPPAFLADIQTYREADTATLRYDDLDAAGTSVFVEEEQSADAETEHVGEQVGYLAFDDGPLRAE